MSESKVGHKPGDGYELRKWYRLRQSRPPTHTQATGIRWLLGRALLRATEVHAPSPAPGEARGGLGMHGRPQRRAAGAD